MNNAAETPREIALKEADKFLCSLDLAGEAEYSLIIYKKVYGKGYGVLFTLNFSKWWDIKIKIGVELKWRFHPIFDEEANRWVASDKKEHQIEVRYKDDRYTFEGADLRGLEFYKSLTFPNISNEILKFGDVLSTFAEAEEKELNS